MADKIKLSDIRAQFPMYKDVPDDQLLIGLRQKYYSDIKPGDFYNKIDFDTQKIDPAAGMSGFDRFMVGAGAQADRALSGLKKLIPGVDESQQSKDDRAIYQKYRDNLGTAGKAGEIATDVALTAMPVGRAMEAANAGVRMLPKAMQVLGKGGILPAAAAGGAVSAALDPDDRGGAAAGGAFGGALGQGIGKGLTRTFGGAFTPTAEARALMDQGIQPSVGQATGGLMNTIEQRASSVPFLGGVIDAARRRPFDEFQGSVLNRALGRNVKNLDEANDAVKASYDAFVPSMKPTADSVTRVQGAVRNAQTNPELTPDRLQMLQGIVNKNFANFGQLDGQGIKKLDSELGHLGRKYAKGSPADQTMSDEIYNVLGGLREGIETGLPQNLRGAHAEANAAYKNMIPVNKAASQRADERIMPRAYQKALARQQGVDVSRAAADDLVDPAVKVLSNNVPDSGTAGRMLQNSSAALLGLPLGAVAAPFGTRTGQAALLGNLPGQAGIRRIGNEYLVPALRSFGTVAGN